MRVLVFLMLWPLLSIVAGALLGAHDLKPEFTPTVRVASAPKGPVMAGSASNSDQAFRARWGLSQADSEPSEAGNAGTHSGIPVSRLAQILLYAALGGFGAWVASMLPTWYRRRTLAPDSGSTDSSRSEAAFRRAMAADGWLTRQKAGEAPPHIYSEAELAAYASMRKRPADFVPKTWCNSTISFLIGYVLGSHHRL